MAEVQKYSLIEELRKADENLKGSPSLLGMTALTYPNYINSMRSTMFTSHLKQFLNLLEPDIPYVFTNTENMVGDNSHGYKKTKNPIKVVRKITKYEGLIENPNTYILLVFDTKEEKYDIIHRNPVKDLTENFGYKYDNTVIDSLKEGDKIKKGTVLYKSTSYDDMMNYGYGKNITIAYTLDPYTSEDAAVASRSLCEKMTSIESDSITIGLNNNDYPLNLYGRNEKEYKPFPEIGDRVSDILVATRRQFNSQLLFDFKDESLCQILPDDSRYYIDKDVEILDYVIYNNNDEIIDNPFYSQINKYLRYQTKYYKEVAKACKEIMDSGYEYTRDVEYEYKRAIEMIENKKKWRDKDSQFSNMEIEVKIARKAPLAKACKISPRYGNKSVISQIREDDEMPYTKDGRRIDLLLNLLAIINRTTSMPLFEIFITGAAYQVRQQMKKLDTLEEKANMLFEFINVFNKKECAHVMSVYDKCDDKEGFIQDAIDDGIYINIVPMWEDEALFYKCMYVMEKFPFLKYDDLYIKKYGREIKLLNKYWVGEQYCMKLKQSDRRGFSARATGAIDNRGLPTRSFKSKAHLEQHSTSCIRFRNLNPYIVICKINLVNCWKNLTGDRYSIIYYLYE